MLGTIIATVRTMEYTMANSSTPGDFFCLIIATRLFLLELAEGVSV